MQHATAEKILENIAYNAILLDFVVHFQCRICLSLVYFIITESLHILTHIFYVFFRFVNQIFTYFVMGILFAAALGEFILFDLFHLHFSFHSFLNSSPCTPCWFLLHIISTPHTSCSLAQLLSLDNPLQSEKLWRCFSLLLFLTHKGVFPRLLIV